MDRRPAGHLLQILDETYRGYQDSRWVLDAAGNVPRTRVTVAGMALVDAQLLAAMRRTIANDHVEFDLRPYRTLAPPRSKPSTRPPEGTAVPGSKSGSPCGDSRASTQAARERLDTLDALIQQMEQAEKPQVLGGQDELKRRVLDRAEAGATSTPESRVAMARWPEQPSRPPAPGT